MNIIISSPNSKKSKNVNVFETKGYNEFLNRTDMKTYTQYIRENPGATIKQISEHFNEEELYIKTIINIWVTHWTSFFSIGRIINKEDKFYSLSPSNPTIRHDKPETYNY